MKTPDISIIIVNYNTKELLQACLRSLEQAKTSSDSWEIVVVDNASKDGSVDFLTGYKNIFCIFNKTNVGFAAANNKGIRASHGAYVLLLNSDTEVHKDTIGTMLQFMREHPKAGVATCRVVLPDGRMDPACHRGFPTPWAASAYFLKLEKLFPASRIFAQYHMGYKNVNEAHQIDSPSGAFFLTDKRAIQDAGLLDEDYFMYGEDLDWAYRIKKKGWEIWFTPKTSILHRKKQSGRAHKDKAQRVITERYFYETMQTFYRKHYRKQYPWIVTGFILGLVQIRISVLKMFGI